MDANQVVGRRRGDRRDARRSPSSTRGGSRSRRAPTTSSGTRGSARRSRRSRVATGEHVQNRVVFKQLLQAERDRRLPDRRLPSRRRQRGARGAAARGEVRRAGVPARRRRRAVRVRAAPRGLRLRRASAARSRTAWSSGSTTCTSTSATPPVVRDGRYVLPHGARLQHRDAARVARRVRVPGRAVRGTAEICRGGERDVDAVTEAPTARRRGP